MAADLFESYAVTLVAALILGQAAFGQDGLVFPLIVSTVGVLIAIVGVFITRLRASDRNGLTAINRAFYISAVLSAVRRRRRHASSTCRPTFADFGDGRHRPGRGRPAARTRGASPSARSSSASCWPPPSRR